MFNQAELGNYSVLLPCDMAGNLPEPGDDWRSMEWGLDSVDACDADVIELLDEIWWPQLVRLATEIRNKVREME